MENKGAMYSVVKKAPLVLGAVASVVLLTACSQGKEPSRWAEYANTGAYSAAISESGRFLSLGSTLHGGSLWEVATDERLFNWNHRVGDYSIIAATAFSPDEKFAVTANQQDLVLWDVSSGQPQGFWSSPAEILSIDLSVNGDLALLGLADHTAVLFDVKNGGAQRILRHDARVRSVDLDLEQGLAITGSDAYKARLWDLNTGTELQQVTFDNVVDTVALSPDGRKAFSSATLNRAVIWDTATGEELITLTSDKKFFAQRISYLSARFSSDGSQLITGSTSGIVQLWDVATGKELNNWKVHKRDVYGPTHAGVYDVAFSQGKKVVAVGSNGIMNILE